MGQVDFVCRDSQAMKALIICAFSQNPGIFDWLQLHLH